MRWLTAQKAAVSVVCAYEVVAVMSGRVPTVSAVCRRCHPWLGLVILGSLAVHLYATPAEPAEPLVR